MTSEPERDSTPLSHFGDCENSRVIDISKPNIIAEDHLNYPYVASKTVYEHHKHPIYACSFNPYLPSRSTPILATAAKNTISIYKCPLETNDIFLTRTFKDASHLMDIFTLAWCYDISDKAHRLAVGGYSGLIRLIDPNTGARIQDMHGHGDHVNEIRTDPNNSMIFASVSKDTTVRIWNIRVSAAVAVLGGIDGHKDQVLSLDWSLDSKFVVSSSMDHSIRLWHVGAEDVQERIRESMTIECMKSGHSDKTVMVHFPMAVNTDLHSNYVDCVRFIGHYVVSKGSDQTIVIFRFGDFGDDLSSMSPKLQVDTSAVQLERMDLPFSEIWFIKCDIDPLNRWIVSGNKVGQICMWDLTDGLPEPQADICLQVAECCIRQVCFGANGRIMIAVADDYSVTRIERIFNGEMVPGYKNRFCTNCKIPSAKKTTTILCECGRRKRENLKSEMDDC